MADHVIQQLMTIPGLRIECPRCSDEFPIRSAKLFGMYDAYSPAVQKIIDERRQSAKQLKDELEERKRQLTENKKKKPEKISISAEVTNFGQISEQILPAFLTFPYKRDECRILFKPIDYIVFSGLSEKGCVEVVKFVELKTGDGCLTRRQRQIRDRVIEGKIKHKVID